MNFLQTKSSKEINELRWSTWVSISKSDIDSDLTRCCWVGYQSDRDKFAACSFPSVVQSCFFNIKELLLHVDVGRVTERVLIPGSWTVSCLVLDILLQGWAPVCVCSYLHARTDWFPLNCSCCFDCSASPVFDLTADRHGRSIKQSINNRYAFWVLASCCETFFFAISIYHVFSDVFLFRVKDDLFVALFDSAG